MTREQAKQLTDASLAHTYGGQFIPSIHADIDDIYNDLEAYLDEAMQKAKTWDAHVALQDVKEYLEGKEDD